MTTERKWTSRDVRSTFLGYFESKGHTVVASSSLVPADDPTLLFTNAGMNQFKDVFLGREKRGYVRAASSQKCVRAGGKHNDLDNVGYTARHHTFFEMLGNFSFGDYFKADAIDFAWELVTGPTWYGLDPARLWATVYRDDDEAAALWENHLPPARIRRFGEKDNFWAMGDTGPCGPCSELHYDQGPRVPGDDTPNGRGDRVMEIWNLVFMQFDRDASGKMTPLPKPSVDTGAGLERITAILEGKNNNYDTDLFTNVIRRLEELSGRSYAGNMAVEDAPFRVIADHARAATMLMADGVIPSNEGRGYVLRRILRRAFRYGRRLGVELNGNFLAQLVDPVLSAFEGIHFSSVGDIVDRGRFIRPAIRIEETQFSKTISVGADKVGEEISAARREAEKSGEGHITLGGPTVFHLYDTFGVPLELIEEIAGDEGIRVDRGGFESEMARARERSKGASKFEAEKHAVPDALIDPSWQTEFRGYPEDDFVSLDGARVLALFAFPPDGGAPAPAPDSAPKGEVAAVLDRTVFYPEGGGQVADQGELLWKSDEGAGRAAVLDARRSSNGKAVLHFLRIDRGSLRPGMTVAMKVDEWTRRKTQANHTGTHLLHAALRKVLGESVRQMGSLVAPDRLRFDYAAARPTSPAELREIERLVNEEILRDRPVSKDVMSMDAAKAKGAIMFFGEKYGEQVRVVDVAGFSTELCGGCHVRRTGEIGAFKVVSDRGLAAGVRRLEAVTSLNAVERMQKDEEILLQLSQIANAQPHELPAKLRETLESLRRKEKEIAQLKTQLAGAGSRKSDDDVVEISGVRVLARLVPSLPANELRSLADTFRSKLKSGIVLLGTEAEEGKVLLLAAVTPDLSVRVPAGDLAQEMARVVGGKGGGKPDLAQAGGRDPSKIEEALERGVARIRERLAG
ncbi:MAG TPA: alanine--tRNA ligase [Thermoanaerobaculia bacterium]|nr:alanine--tRNA ligase [Thermoanaerobaculia bacterium]